MTNKEKAILTYKMLQARKKRNTKKTEQDYLAHTIDNINRIYRRNCKGKRKGEL